MGSFQHLVRLGTAIVTLASFALLPAPGLADTFELPPSARNPLVTAPTVPNAPPNSVLSNPLFNKNYRSNLTTPTASQSFVPLEASPSLLVPAVEAIPEPPSAMERFFAVAPGYEDASLKQFGYDLFSGGVAGDGLAAEGAVPGTYPLGVGDELVINVPLVVSEIRTVVNRDGTIFIPNFGTMSVVGQTLEQFQTALRQRARGAQISVRLGRLRTLTVYLAGRVKKPGSYTVSALSTITSLLQAGGGVLKNGSLRSIQLRRGTKTVANFDVYDFLLKGQGAGNVRLEAGDILFVPSIGPQVAVAGNVQQPGIYELKGGTTIEDALELAGGTLAQAYTERIQLQRIRPNAAREVRTLDLTAQGVAQTKLRDGDLVGLGGVLTRIENAVTLKGQVERPGIYEIRPGDRVSKVLRQRTELKPEVYFDYAQILREVGDDRHIEIVPFNLGKALDGDPTDDLVLQPRDTVQIYSLNDFREQPQVDIYGAVLHPGKYRLYPNLSVAELIQAAGGLRPEADTGTAELTRTIVDNNQTKVVRQNFSPLKALSHQGEDNIHLAKDDAVLIKQVANYHTPWRIEISGEVANPGTYTILEGETLASVVERAGGYNPRAYLPAAVFTREPVRQLQQRQLDEIADRLEQEITSKELAAPNKADPLAAQKTLLKNLREAKATGRIVIRLGLPKDMRSSPDDLRLVDGDKLYVPAINETVSVLGAVYSPNSLKYDGGMSVRDYLFAAGGSTPQGDPDNLYVIRADGQIHSIHNYREGWWIFSRSLLSCRLNPGDTIVIPEKIDTSNPLADWASIASGFASVITSGALLYNTVK